MNVRRVFYLATVSALTSLGSLAPANAAVNNTTASGGFRPMSAGQQTVASSHGSGVRRAYHAPTNYQPSIAPQTEVAQTPAEGRRFSYAPSTSAVPGNPCGAVNPPSTARQADSNRRFSYEPNSPVESAPLAPTYHSQPRYSRSAASRPAKVEPWQMQKTDPRKYLNK